MGGTQCQLTIARPRDTAAKATRTVRGSASMLCADLTFALRSVRRVFRLLSTTWVAVMAMRKSRSL